MSLAMGSRIRPPERRLSSTVPRAGQSSLSSTQPRELMTTKLFENRMQKRLQEQVNHETLSCYHTTNQRLSANNLSDDRVEVLRRMRRFQKQNNELLTGYRIEAAKREEEERRLLSEQDRQLAAAIAHIKNEKLSEEMNTKRIVDESEELSELREKIKAAEMNAKRAIQLQEKNIIVQQDKQREAAMDAAMEEERKKGLIRESIEKKEKDERLKSGKKILEDQMQERAYRSQLAYQAFLKEKSMVDEIVKSIEEDDKEKERKAARKRHELQDNIRIFLLERERWRQEEKKRAEEELLKIKEYQIQQQARYDELQRLKKKKKETEDSIVAKITAEMETKRREQQEMELLLFELYQEEAEQKAIEEIRQREEKMKKMREEMIRANEYQKQLKLQKKAQQEAEEEIMREKLLEKFIKDKQIELLNEQKRKQEMMDYKKEVERLIAEKKRLYELSVDKEMESRRKEQEELEYKIAVIERERQRLLENFASKLKDYLPKGVFRDKEEFEKIMGRRPNNNNNDSINNIGGIIDAPDTQVTENVNARYMVSQKKTYQ